MKLSILNQAPISAGTSAKDALIESVKLAQLGERLGYTRYWIAEHHDMSGLACPTPDVMLGIIGTQTSRIRIGSGAVLLPHYKPFKVAETYNMLATLFFNRIDLGLGRAPGGSAEATMALSDNFLEQVKKMPESLDELLHFIHNDFSKGDMYTKIKPTPVPQISPEPWLLGTSEKSAILAAEKGMAYAFGHFMSDQEGPSIVRNYVKKYKHKYSGMNPKAIVAVSVICAETTIEAEEIAESAFIWSVQRAKGEDTNGVPSIEDAKNYAYSNEEHEMIHKWKRKMIIGNPREVRSKLEELQKLYNVNEFMLVTITHSYEARLKSYELIAKEMLSVS
ncbi:LLM class flavin-dependent oxidoreductase [Virgibacillus ndiopensis]|uniref:LLM class flavin-dependent oxidoreductase n=1 Tax=Virgibacillus ndiopensis TaxID=2004408 RepID=UPI000C076C5C|nr:LLM class flavin-dependent oxidoreductase [Virgibacillus ndiopensis]